MHFLKMNGVADDNQLTQKIKDFLFYFDSSLLLLNVGSACMPLTAQLSCIGWGKGGLSYNQQKLLSASLYYLMLGIFQEHN